MVLKKQLIKFYYRKLNDLNSRQEISSQLDKSTKKLTLTNPNIAD